jgi:hypothetical protein
MLPPALSLLCGPFVDAGAGSERAAYPVGESNPYCRVENPVSWPLDERGLRALSRTRCSSTS